MPNQVDSRSAHKVRRLLETLSDRRSLLIVMQDNPDPDSIASAASLRRIANQLGDVTCSIAYGGKIGRGENRALADYLGLNFRPIDQVDPKKFDAIALVATQPGTGNNSLPDDVRAHIVLDHHPLRPGTRSVPFTDVRSRYGALSSILVEYLREADIVPEAGRNMNACGAGAMAATVAAARALGCAGGLTVEYTTSYDVVPDREFRMAVGYVGMIFCAS